MTNIPQFEGYSKSQIDTESVGCEPTRVEHACSSINEIAGIIAEQCSDLISVKEELANSWEGERQVAFNAVFDEIVEKVSEIRDYMNEFSEAVDQLKADYVKFDTL